MDDSEGQVNEEQTAPKIILSKMPSLIEMIKNEIWS